MKKYLLMFFFFSLLFFWKKKWPIFRHETFLQMDNISSCCSIVQAFQMMDLTKENNIQTCIQLGVLPELSMLTIAKTLKFKKTGKVYAIDSWKKSDYKNTKNLINKHRLTKYCEIIRKTPESVVDRFADNSIDLIYLNETRCKETIIKDIILYFPKVKDGGYILLNDPNQDYNRQALVYLLERTDIISSFSDAAEYMLFRKNSKKMKHAKSLMKDKL